MILRLVRFKEKDVMFDDELKFKSCFSEETEWNCIKLDRSGKSFILKAPLADFKDLEDEKDSMFAIYAELALAKGDKYIISKDVELNSLRITDDILKDIKTDKSPA
jgi:predicted nucleic acid-binding protein